MTWTLTKAQERVLAEVRANPGLTGTELISEGHITIFGARELFALEQRHLITYREQDPPGWYAVRHEP